MDSHLSYMFKVPTVFVLIKGRKWNDWEYKNCRWYDANHTMSLSPKDVNKILSFRV